MTTSPDQVYTTALTETEQRNLRAVADVLPYWNSRDLAGVLGFYDDAITWRNVGLEETYHGKGEVGEFLSGMFSAFPDLHFEVTHKIARGNNVAEEWLFRGTHLGSYMGIPATGRPVQFPGMSMIELRDGKFLEDHFYYDAAAIMRQIGLMPPLSATRNPAVRAVLWAAVNRGKVGRAVGGVAAIWAVRRLWRLVKR